MNLLQIDSSARERSVSRALTQAFVEAWKSRHPEGQVIVRDLNGLHAATVTDDWVEARDTDPTAHTPEQRRTLELSDQLIEELYAADVIVFGSPMYNFNISAPLKAWIDLIVREGRTVDFTVRPPKGLLLGKKLVVVTARGGSYGAGTPTAGFDFQEPYLRHIFGVLGITDVSFIHADRQLYGEEVAAASREQAQGQIRQLVDSLLQEAA